MRVARREALLQPGLQRVVPGLALVGRGVDGVEVRIRTQQALAGDRRRAEDGPRGDRHQAEERIGHVRAQVVDRRLVAGRARAQILQRRRVDVARRLDVRAAVADVGRLEHHLPGQLALDADLEALHPRRLGLGIEEGDALAEERLDALRGALRLLNAPLEWIRQGLDERQAVVERGHHGGRRAEAGREDVAAALAEEPVEDAVAAAQDRLVIDPVGPADAAA